MKQELVHGLGLQRKIDINGTAAFDRYAHAIGESGLCPYIPPAICKGLLFAIEQNLIDAPCEELEAWIFYYALLATEQFRRIRLDLRGHSRELLCTNIIYQLPDANQHDAEVVLKVPHRLLRCFYASANIMFGKFWIGEQAISLHGKSIPSPPCNFIAIRSIVKQRDPDFLKQDSSIQEITIATLIQSIDTGNCLFEQQSLPHPLAVPNDISITGFYYEYKNWLNQYYSSS